MLQPKLISAEASGPLELRLVYETGEVKLFDASPYAHGPWYGELQNPAYFRTVHLIDGGADEIFDQRPIFLELVERRRMRQPPRLLVYLFEHRLELLVRRAVRLLLEQLIRKRRVLRAHLVRRIAKCFKRRMRRRRRYHFDRHIITTFSLQSIYSSIILQPF